MQIKIENTEITLKTFTIKYSDDFNILSYTYKTKDKNIIESLNQSIKKFKFECTFLNETKIVTIFPTPFIESDNLQDYLTFKLKLKF